MVSNPAGEDAGDQRPLEGVTVIDCASLYAGPLAATYLGDFGAEVIKVEHPDGGDPIRAFGGDGHSWDWVGRNKRSVPLDLRDERGAAAFLDLVAEADVLVESFRPGTLEKWGLGWETCSAVNPGLVMVRTTGFGQDGPYADRPGFGSLCEAMSGFAYSTGEAEGPPTLPPIALADTVCALHSAFAAMTALYWRDQGDGTGQYVDASILESMFATMGDVVTRYHADGSLYRRNGNTSRMSVPRNTYETADGRWVALSGSTENVARRILRIVGGDNLVERYPDMATRIDHSDEIDAIIADWMADRERDEVVETFEAHEAALGPVYNMADIFGDEHFDARDAVVIVDGEGDGGTGSDGSNSSDGSDSGGGTDRSDGPDGGDGNNSGDNSTSGADASEAGVAMRNVFPKLSETPGGIDHAGRPLGADAEQVLTELAGLSVDDVDRLVDAGVTTTGE
jgi:crotonobetainyl-CoA:carnitine CoA-transferase CaiB-like acyl-CoA transferase